jgi:hypothetical protein
MRWATGSRPPDVLDASRDSDGEDDPRPIEMVYDQYWTHVRHVEDEM